MIQQESVTFLIYKRNYIYSHENKYLYKCVKKYIIPLSGYKRKINKHQKLYQKNIQTLPGIYSVLSFYPMTEYNEAFQCI